MIAIELVWKVNYINMIIKIADGWRKNEWMDLRLLIDYKIANQKFMPLAIYEKIEWMIGFLNLNIPD